MLYKSTKTGKIYKGVDNAFVLLNPDGRVTVHIGTTDHTYNFINLESFEHCLEKGEVPHFKTSYEHVAKAFLDKEIL